jgi:hypothetical protein
MCGAFLDIDGKPNVMSRPSSRAMEANTYLEITVDTINEGLRAARRKLVLLETRSHAVLNMRVAAECLSCN